MQASQQLTSCIEALWGVAACSARRLHRGCGFLLPFCVTSLVRALQLSLIVVGSVCICNWD